MKINFSFFIFLPIAIFGFASSLAQELPQIVIENADDVAIYDLIRPDDDLFDAGDASFSLPLQAAVCQADDAVYFDLVRPPDEFFDPAPDVQKISKTPVLFVPGLLSTRVHSGQEELWPNATKMVFDIEDNFLDDLQLNNNFIPANNDLNFKEVIKTEPTINYLQGLIDEFAGQGYNATEGSADQAFYTFPYDWRYGVSGTYPDSKTNYSLLKEKIDRLAEISPTGKVDVVAHSLGGLIVKKYVLDNSDPKIGKLIFLGVPNFGAPLAGRALISGTDFGVFGLNPWELKKIAQNMPAAYDLLPSREYFESRGPWINIVKATDVFGVNQTSPLDYTQTRLYLAGVDLNQIAINNAADLHSSDFDGGFVDDVLWAKGIDAYNIVGCQSATFSTMNDWQDQNGIHRNYAFWDFASGDDTVPFESANQRIAKDANTFYAPKVKHGQMPSQPGVRKKIVNIIASKDLAISPGKIISHSELLDNPNQCKLFGISIKIESPLAIKIANQDGNIIEDVADVGIKNEIPGAGFEIIGDEKLVYLPQDGSESYQINLRGTGAGLFTLIVQEITGDVYQDKIIFANMPVDANTQGKLKFESGQAVLELDQDADGQIDQIISRSGGWHIDLLVSEFARFVGLGLVQKPQAEIWRGKLKNLQSQIAVYQKNRVENNRQALAALADAINRHIDGLADDVRQSVAHAVDEKTALVLVEALDHVRLKE